MPRIEGSVCVLTGASSGIARRTAVVLAERGATLVLAARDESSLKEAAEECEDAGAPAMAVPTDVADEDAVRELARRSQAEFGRIDVWINAAAVIAYGGFLEVPPEVYRRVLEINLFGQIHGARAALPCFLQQRSGVLVNVASVWGSVTSPYVSSYVVSKFGVRALSECLQEALRLEEPHDIHVCTILPVSVDTPIFRHAANYSGRQAKPVPPILGPDRVVRAILKSIEKPRRQRTVGLSGLALEAGHALIPSFYSKLVPRAMKIAALGKPLEGAGAGNVFEPMPEWNQVSGGWRHKRFAVLKAGAGVGAAAAIYRLAKGSWNPS